MVQVKTTDKEKERLEVLRRQNNAERNKFTKERTQ